MTESVDEKKPSILLLSFVALWILVGILLAFQDIPVEEALTGYSEDEPVKLPELVAT